MTVLVVGASGRLGNRVARRLLDDGIAVRATSRDPARVVDLAVRGAEVARCDLRDPRSVREAVDGVNAVVHATHALGPSSRRNSPRAVDGLGVATLIDAAARCRVDHFVLSSVVDARADHAVAFCELKWAGEQQLRRSGLPHTILRMTAFAELHVLTLLGDPIRDRGRVVLLGPGTAPRNFVSVDDAAAVVVDAVHPRGSGAGRGTVTLAGPAHFCDREAVDLVEQALGVTARRHHVPLAALEAGGRVLRRAHPGLGLLLEMAAREAVVGQVVDLSPRPDLVIGTRSLEDVVRSWADAGGACTDRDTNPGARCTGAMATGCRTSGAGTGRTDRPWHTREGR